jgi:hypothetical protein
VLDFLGISHDGNGFFEKDSEAAAKLTEGWQRRVYDHFHERYPEPLLLFYINHLDWELTKPDKPFVI